ncbi:hypothetical protein HV265_12945 [Citrobacter sp. RHBSTW-00678]|uniref:hypothetical protein n=1 Tax=Citrobacter sp. RHBSTW-00678 TaxID=2742661 RepID=UPI0015EA0186|nr:hypothetical protein [Citrobacter sp. RHBSTW-00678]QLV87825.1 hypothetical protein HV265_12945 [Citrobacter sp. RHBSTW-00678]
MRFLLILALCLPLLGCDSTDEKVIKVAKNAIAEQLMDPDAAKFSDVYVHRGESGVANDSKQKSKYQYFTVCGSVNGKNAFGAYTGKTRFMVSLVNVDSESKPSVIHSVYEDEGLKKSAITPPKTESPQSLFEYIYWNKDCVDEQHPKTYTGKN